VVETISDFEGHFMRMCSNVGEKSRSEGTDRSEFYYLMHSGTDNGTMIHRVDLQYLSLTCPHAIMSNMN